MDVIMITPLTGFKASIGAMRSGRMPFGRSLYVGGKRLMRLKSRNPDVAYEGFVSFGVFCWA